MKRIKLFVLIIPLFAGFIYAKIETADNYPDNSPSRNKWVDSVFQSLTPEQRIAQLFIVPAYSNQSIESEINSKVTEQIKLYNIGGICFFQGGPIGQSVYTNYWQSIAPTPLLIAIDGEWGLGMRLKDSAVSFPYQMTLGAIQDNDLIYEMGEEIGRQMKRMGIHINFAPVVDINSNPNNPVINYRSFGEDKLNVSNKAMAYMKGMQKQGVMATAKHFPGHGDTDKDSHTTLPVIHHSQEMIDTTDLFPFRTLIKNGISAVMCAHLSIPALDTTRNLPSSLSAKVIYNILVKHLGFKGLVFTDALGMKGASESDTAGSLELKALLAGNDLLLMSEDLPHAIEFIQQAVDSGLIDQKVIDDKCKKILTYKYKAGLAKRKPVKVKNLYYDINNRASEILNLKLYEASVTLIKNNQNILPLKQLQSRNIASVSFNDKGDGIFDETLDYYAPVTHFNMDKTFNEDSISSLLLKLSGFNTLIININQLSNSQSGNYGFSDAVISFISQIKKEKDIVLNLQVNPYCLAKLTDTSGISAILTSYQCNSFTKKVTAEAIFGGISVKGKLPVSASVMFPVTTGIKTEKMRFNYTYPECAGMNPDMLRKVDSIALKGIKDTIFPGCQILAAKDGKVFYYKSFGYHTYEKMIPVNNSDIYDIASITKIAATTLAVMKLSEDGKISLDTAIENYYTEAETTTKACITIRQILTHQAGFKAWIPFYKNTLVNGKPDTNIYKKVFSDDYPVRVADSMFIHKNFADSIYMTILNSELRKNNNYLYSDLGFYLLVKIIERLENVDFSKYVSDNFYRRLGLNTVCFEPRKYYDISRIIPSEIDTNFRMQLIHGDVNDQGAAMLGGTSGHAGLFSSSKDLAIMMQMLINEGVYAGERYFMPETVSKFTEYQTDKSRRALGFDKPLKDKHQGGPACEEASKESYGHSGFTGTYVWADPEYKLIYVFLSNRTYPYSENNKLVKSGIRTAIQKIIYQAIED
ncbi:MAG: glycoside hydrolase family 3 N-terminal domain-containing protein [Bacteroidales bacterium]|jgi:beta-glucosidase-like glycosyl hydrolase/CubicO group peptidase (beta-lactamase class C family)|nr:serine hydrolase [Bacteroidales bacterium]MDD4214697.1 glycoside hydrolase family 3 N-terminal domain-containing protein [Bacteroidales bacterium]